jgi:quercetin dioxygenase-like cupin family protein
VRSICRAGRQHLHPDADEEFIVKEGKLKPMVDGKWRVLVAGEKGFVQSGVPIARPKR